jgi:hypothetical protein
LLRWLGRAVAPPSPWISSNKARIDFLFIYFLSIRFLLLPAGRGGEGELQKCFDVDGSRGSRSSLAVLVFWCDARWSPMEVTAGLSRGKQVRAPPVAKLLLFFSNKHLRRPPLPLPGGAVLVSLRSASRGGKGDGGIPAAALLRQVFLLPFRAQHMVDMFVAMICGRVCRSSRRLDGALSTSRLEAPDGVLHRRYTPPSIQVVRPRVLVVGGRSRGSDDIVAGGEDFALDCFFIFFARSFLLNSKDQSVIPFFRGPSCICTHRSFII